jgi:hypothetical protein
MLISFKAGAHDPDSLKFKQHGNPILKVFSNFNTSISEGIDDGGFEIRRAYLGYEYFLSPEFEIAIKLDIGSPNDASEYSLLRRFAYFKNAYVRYNWNNLSTQFGIVDVYQFKLQEKYWAHRYIWESFMDEFNFGPSADLGWNITYKFADFVSADFGLYNGEGYSKLQNDNAFKAGLGVSLLPVKGLLVRIYGDAIKKTNYQTTLAGFVGYTYENKFIGGVEYNYQFNNRYLEGQDKYGFSFYASYYITSKWQLFTRYDQVYSNVLPDNENPWDLEEDGSAVVGGVEFSPIRQIKIALNYQDWTPYAKNLISQSYLYLNFEYKL